MAVKIVVIAFLLIILFNLGTAAWAMYKGDSDKTLQALTRRIILSVVLFGLLLLAMATGLIEPHGLTRGG